MDYILYVDDGGLISVMDQNEFKLNHSDLFKTTLPQKNTNEDENQNESGGENKNIVKDEVDSKGKVLWQDYKNFFSYSVGGIYGIVLVILLHFVINFCSVAVSIYLALTLTNHLNASDQ